MKIEIRDFSGIAPRYSPELLADNAGQTACNLSIKSGKIHPEKPFTILAPDRDYAPGQVNDDQYDRLYFLDGGTVTGGTIYGGTMFVGGTFRGGGTFHGGTLCMYGRFSGNSYSIRKVDMVAPNTVTLTVKSSPLLDALGRSNNGKMAFNYNSNSWKSTYNIADLYAQRFLTSVDADWSELADGTLTRSYSYNNTYAVIVWPRGRMAGD